MVFVFGGFFIVCIVFWLIICVMEDGRKVVSFVEWMVRKDFFEYCYFVSYLVDFEGMS